MQMSTDPNHYGVFPHSFSNQHVVSFQPSSVTSGSGAIPVCLDTSSGMNGSMAIMNTTSSTIVSTGSPNMTSDSSGQSLKYSAPMAVEWSYPELQMLNDGLIKYANEPGIMKYIKIASVLPDKTVRDVAMRCQWMAARKEATRRRKPEEHYLGKKIKDRKDKMAEPSSRVTNPPVQTDMRASAFMPCNTRHNNGFLSGDSQIDREMLNILEENARLLNQIEINIFTSQAQNNIDLFHHTRRNINGLLQSMSQIPGIMSKMPPLPISVDERLASYILPRSPMVTKFRCGGIVVGCTFDHRVCDAYSFNMFLVAWSAAARGGPAPPAPSFRRSLLAPRHPAPPSTDGTLADRLFVPVSLAPALPDTAAANRIYRVSAADVAALQAAAGPGRTKLEAFTAHLWRLHARAATRRRIGSCCMGVVVDGRTRLRGGDGDGAGAMGAYFGNVLSIPYGVMGAGALRGASLADVAGDVHRWVAEAATGEHFRELVDWVEARRPEPTVARAYLGRGAGGEGATACVVSSGMRLPVGEVDFGWGRPAFASYHFPWPGGAGYVMPMPSARGDGDWVVYVHVAPEVVEAMEEEPTVFRALDGGYMFDRVN